MDASETNDTLSVEAIARKTLVGIDAHDREHYFDPVRDTVYVLDGTTHVYHEDLDPGQLPEWVAFIREECGGWTDVRTNRSLTEELAAAVHGGETA